ncbi:amidase [Aureispira anguillae]|uniref:Amidase n=1 Tax=Aureispira anguillae TaxID=2864201 RepID=A0A915YHC0_9BACT|nr:amidase [Aureispira anguillae]BDS12948.1 amidase [Aureispira anguillae]
MNQTIIQLSATALASKIKNKELSVLQVLTAFLEQIEKQNPSINAISDLRSKSELLEEARAKDALLQTGQAVGPLFGVPIAIKESFLVKGLQCSNGNPSLRNYKAKEDAELVKRIKDAGGIIVGMTNVPLFCIDWQSTNFWNGQTNNPHDLSRVAGGSSGGSAAAVAANFTPISIGSDVGGSIRVPAHFCGIVGLKPTENLLPERGHLKNPNRPQGRRHVVASGPFAKTIDDLILMMRVLANHKKYPLAEIPAVDFEQSKWEGTNLKIAISETINQTEVDDEYLAIFRRFITKLKQQGHTMANDHPVYDEKAAYVACSEIVGFEMSVNGPKIAGMSLLMYAFIFLKYRDHWWAKGMANGQRLSSKKYAKALDFKDQLTDLYHSFLTQYDIWITPVCALEAYPHQKAGKPFVINRKKIPYTKAIASFTFTTAFSGHPIVVIPIGKKKNGMPVGIQIHAQKWQDKKLLEIAKYLGQFADNVVNA